jgi:hypothetical protein
MTFTAKAVTGDQGGGLQTRVDRGGGGGGAAVERGATDGAGDTAMSRSGTTGSGSDAVEGAGGWRYLCRAVDQFGHVIDVLLAEGRPGRRLTSFSPGPCRARRR